jgi:hypothetical protein
MFGLLSVIALMVAFAFMGWLMHAEKNKRDSG